MALSFAHGAIQWLAADAATTVYTVSGLSFQPKAIRFYWQGLQNAADANSEAVHLRRGLGFATSTSDRQCVGSQDQDAAGTMVCTTGYRTDCVAMTLTSTPVADGLLDLNSITSDGFTCIVDDQAPANITVFWEAWGGSDITNAATVAIAEPAATGVQEYAAGFSPDVVLFAGVQATGANPTAARGDSGLCLGVASGSNAAQNIVVVGNQDDGSTSADTDGYCQTGECLAMITVAGGSPSARATCVGFTPDGFRLNWLERATTNRRAIALAIRGGAWRAGSYTIDGNTGSATATVSGLPFTPVGLSLLGRMTTQNTVDTATANDRLGLGSGSSTSSRRTQGSLSEDATASSAAEINHTIQYDQILAFPSTAGALLSAYDINAMNADGFQIIVDTAGGVASEWQGYLTFGNQVSPSPESHIAVPDRPRTLGIAGLTIALSLLQSTLAPVAAEPVYLTAQTTLLIARQASPRVDPPNLLTSSLAVSPVPFAEDDWSLPSRLAIPIGHRTHVAWRELSLVDESLIGQASWSLPVAQRHGDLSPAGVNLLTSTLAAPAAAPFQQTEWIQPRRGTGSLLVSTQTRPAEDSVVAGTPIAPLDWPTPLGRLSPLSLRTSTDSRKPFHVDLTPASLTAWPVPDARYGHRALGTWVQALQQGTLGLPVGTPASQTEWLVPAPRAVPSALRTWLQHLLQSTLSLPVGVPTAQDDWPPPRGRADLRGLSWYVNLLESTLAPPVVVAPFAPDDWPLPTRRPRAHVLSWVSYYALDDTVPFAHSSWATPLRPVDRRALLTWTQNLNEHTLFAPPIALPPGRYDWRVPTGTDYPSDLRTWLQERDQFSQDIPPFNLEDWPTPRARGRERDLATIVLNLQQGTLGLPLVVLPENVSDWPLPAGKPYPVSLRTWLQERKGYYVDLTPAHLTEWPIPTGPAAHRELRTWLQHLQQSTLLPTPKPFLVSDWPNPREKGYPLDLRTFLHKVELQLLGKDTFFGGPGQSPATMDWPRPRAKGWPVVEGSQGVTTLLIPPFVALPPTWVIRVPEWPQTILVVEQAQIIVVP